MNVNAIRRFLAASLLAVLALAGTAPALTSAPTAEPPNFGARKEISFDDLRSGFASPSLIYAPFAFWFFDAPLDPDHVAKMAEEMCRQGLNPGYAHARRGLPREEWLSPLWFESFAAALDRADAAAGFLGYCDEYWWPSGRADGRVLAAHPEVEAVSLACTTFDVEARERIDLPESFFTVAARHAGPFVAPPPRPRLGRWIWHPEAQGEGRSAWFRCSATLPLDAAIAFATLSITADNRFVLYVNSTEIARGGDWTEVRHVDAAAALHGGRNVIAVEAANDEGECGVIFGLRVDFADGSYAEVASGADCRAAAEAEEGWADPGFDDSGWAAPVVLGDAGAEPWRLAATAARRPPAVIESKTLAVVGAGGAFSWTAGAGAWRVYSFSKYHHAGIDGGDVNYLDRRLMPAFIEMAHTPYQERFGKRMGKSIPGVFVDNEGDYGYKLAWSDDLDREYRQRTGRDIRLWMPLLLDRDAEGVWPKARWDWFDTVSEIYADNFLGSVSRWLAARGMYCISNLWEESLAAQAFAVGDFFRAQRSVTMPGNDCLVHKAFEVHDFKETQSVSEFEGRRFQSEVLGVAGWQMSPVLMKQAANAVIAWGVSHIVPHGVNVSRSLDTIPYPPDWFTSNPYWRYLHLWTDFCRRASFVNSQGHVVPDVLLLNPMDSVWALMGGRVFDADADVSFGALFEAQVETGEPGPSIRDIETVYRSAIAELTAARVEYLVADRHYLAQMTVAAGGRLARGPFEFKAVVVPSLYVLPLDTARKIAAFAETGGSVYLLGNLPQGSTDHGLADPEMEALMKTLASLPSVRRADEGVAGLVAEGAPCMEPQVSFADGAFSVLGLHRRADGRDFFWLANNTGRAQECRLRFCDARGAASLWDCESGAIADIPSEANDSGSTARLAFEPYEAFWVVFDPERPPHGATEAAAAAPERSGARAAGIAPAMVPRCIELAGPWRTAIDPAVQPPPVSPNAALVIPEAFLTEGGGERPLVSWLAWGLDAFSGFVDYRTTFTLEPGAAARGVLLDLGGVKHTAEVFVNGRPAGARLWPPFEFDVSTLVRPGANDLTVRVGNLLCNAMKPFDNWGWSRPQPEDFDCGLLGPVTLTLK